VSPPASYFAPLTAFAAALGLVWWLARSPLARLALDRPNPRSLHERPVPRTGGIGLNAGFLLAMPIAAPDLPPALWAAFALLLAVSLLDDLRGLAPWWRLPVHLLAAAAFSFSALLASHGALAAAAATLALAWMANLYNFMDGSDGLAGGMAVIGFSCYAIAAGSAGDPGLALASSSIAAAAAAFLFFNFHPARVFLGDAGSVPLGFLAGALGLAGWQRGHWPLWFPLLVFSPFVVDASLTLARRLLRRERVWEAHRDHYYQRLVRLGWGHRGTALAEYALMAGCGALALAARGARPALQAAALAGAGALYAAIAVALERRWRAARARGNRAQ
jgi:UDP-N-acetylmuramyl pentapeptide phosphotransferase/UDP-N-acetylglucosamine-1-phosphate transferase